MIVGSAEWARCLLPYTSMAASPSQTSYTIGDLAREFDLTTRAIRFYEDMGLLQPQRSGPGGRNRIYSLRDRTRLKLTLRAKRLGLSLSEAREIIDMYDSPRDTGPQLRKFLTILAQHRQQLEEQMAELQANLDEVRTHEKEARALLARIDKDKVRA
jgi:DNA-binding transcriptional MerR regulator